MVSDYRGNDEMQVAAGRLAWDGTSILEAGYAHSRPVFWIMMKHLVPLFTITAEIRHPG